MLIGIIGTPNKGKSSLFSALTMLDVKIANHPFTTIDPNKGIAYLTKECIEKELKVKCNARNSLCINGIRYIPINLIDVAGLVEGASNGKGMGNQFLNDLIGCDAFIIVVDASGRTDQEGNFSQDNYNPTKDANIVLAELVKWFSGIILKHKKTYKNNIDAFYEMLGGFKIQKEFIKEIIDRNSLSKNMDWSEKEIDKFSLQILKKSKPFVIAANKWDVNQNNLENNIRDLKNEFGEGNVFECSAVIELALKKADKQGIIKYNENSFEIANNKISDEQKEALNFIKTFLKTKKTNVQRLINELVFRILDNIIAYPVEDENKYTDHFGNVLPDAILIKNGTSAVGLAEIIHSELAKSMLYAINAKTKIKISKNYLLKDNDVIKIVSTAK